jgi:hypothetical protein
MPDKNYGLILQQPKPNDLRFGIFSPIENEALLDYADWTLYLSDFDRQRNKNFDAWDCVSESAVKLLEIQFNYLYHNKLLRVDQTEFLFDKGYLINDLIEFSSRFIAKMSGTIIGYGNTGGVVADTIKKCGLIPSSLWDMTDDMTAEEYYKEIDADLVNLGKEFAGLFPTNWEWIEKPNFADGLKYSPIQIFTDAWHLDTDGQYKFVDGFNHAVALIKAEGNVICDTYEPWLKSLEDGNLQYFGIKYFINFNNKLMANFGQNKLYLLVEGSEQKLAMFLDGALIIYDNKIDTLLNATARSHAYQVPIPLTLKDFNSVPHKDGKGNIIN